MIDFIDSFRSVLKANYLQTDDFVTECDNFILQTLKFKHIAQSVQIAKDIERELSKIGNSGISTDNLLLKINIANNPIPNTKSYKFSIYPNGGPLSPTITGNLATLTIPYSLAEFVNSEYLSISVNKVEINLSSVFTTVLSILLSKELKSFYDTLVLDLALQETSIKKDLKKTKI